MSGIMTMGQQEHNVLVIKATFAMNDERNQDRETPRARCSRRKDWFGDER